VARKTKEDARETREKLLESALEVMCEKPLSKVSMSGIAEKVGLSKGALYWHFKNKNDLLVKLLESIFSRTWNDFYDDSKPPETFADLRGFFKKKLSAAMSSDQIQMINRLFHRRHEWPNDVCEKVIESIRDMTMKENAIVSKIIARSQERGEIASDYPPDEMTILLSAMFHGLFFFQIHELYMIDISKYSDFLFDLFEKALKRDPCPTVKNGRQIILSERDGVTLQ
jgi:TetR/AcrR family acrAB operon transcriptional repressor